MTAGKPHHKARNIEGLTVGYLRALAYHGSDGKKSIWKVICTACQKQLYLAATELLKMQKRQVMASCGCQKNKTLRAKRKTHGMSKHPAYAVWRGMVDRCRLPSHAAWKNYGGRGVQVCDRWEQSFDAFWEDNKHGYRKGLTLDRIDNDGHYCPENTRWVDYHQQANNRRGNTRVPTPAGMMTVAEAARKFGINDSTILYRLAHNWPAHLLLAPPNVNNRYSTSSTAAPITDSQ